MIDIEIKGHFGQCIRGFLKRLEGDNGVIVYADDLIREEIIPLSELRFPPNCPVSGDFKAKQLTEVLLSIGQKENGVLDALSSVEVQHSTSESRLSNPVACLSCPSWWPCVVLKTRDDHVVVQLKPIMPESDNLMPIEYLKVAETLSTTTEICTKDLLRIVTGDVPCLNPDLFFTYKIELPSEMMSYASDPSVHSSIVRSCKGPVTLFVKDSILYIMSPSKEVIRVITLLEETYIRILRQKWAIVKTISHTKRSHDTILGSRDISSNMGIENSWLWNERNFIDNFQVSSSLAGLAIGKQGSNISNARSMPGIINIFINKAQSGQHSPYAAGVNEPNMAEIGSATFTIIAESPEAARAARETLEFCEFCLIIPRRLLARVIGTKSISMTHIWEKSGVRHIYFEYDPNVLATNLGVENGTRLCKRIVDTNPKFASSKMGAEVGICIVGTYATVEVARILLAFQIDCLFDLEKLEEERYELYRDLTPDLETRENGSFQPRARGRGYQPRPPGQHMDRHGDPPRSGQNFKTPEGGEEIMTGKAHRGRGGKIDAPLDLTPRHEAAPDVETRENGSFQPRARGRGYQPRPPGQHMDRHGDPPRSGQNFKTPEGGEEIMIGKAHRGRGEGCENTSFLQPRRFGRGRGHQFRTADHLEQDPNQPETGASDREGEPAAADSTGTMYPSHNSEQNYRSRDRRTDFHQGGQRGSAQMVNNSPRSFGDVSDRLDFTAGGSANADPPFVKLASQASQLGYKSEERPQMHCSSLRESSGGSHQTFSKHSDEINGNHEGIQESLPGQETTAISAKSMVKEPQSQNSDRRRVNAGKSRK